MSNSDFHSKSTYSHLLYLKESERLRCMTNEMSSSWSSTSSRRSMRSTSSLDSTASSSGSTAPSIVSLQSPKWADDHYPLITSIHPDTVPADVPRSHTAFLVAREMAQIHNTLIRGINASYNHSVSIKPSTRNAADFLRFNQLLFKALDHHFHTEETFLFPGLEKMLNQPGSMVENVKGHESFAERLKLFEKYVFVTKPCEFNGRTLRHIIESFAPNLIQHLHNEIDVLLNLFVLDSDALKKVWHQASKIATKDSEIRKDASWLIGCQDRDFEIDGKKCASEMPWMVESIFRKWFSKNHAGVWRFCPSDINGKRRTLPELSVLSVV